MRWLRAFLFASCLWAGCASAQSPVTINVGPPRAGAPIPANFVGLSFGMRALLPNKEGAHFFSPTNAALVQLFRNVGLTHMRLGGTTVESPPSTAIPGEREIDDLFGFAKAAGVNQIIYSFRLMETNSVCNYEETNAILAKYIWDHYRPLLQYFALGNEPDLRRVYKVDPAITDFQSYLAEWNRFAAIILKAVPNAKFAGPDAASASANYTTRFAKAEKDGGSVALITEHFYVGGAGKNLSPTEGIDSMLSTGWTANDKNVYDNVTKPVLADGLPFCFTEANDHYSGGVKDGSDTFAGALWALDFLHWWAEHDAQSVDFHNTVWVANDIITEKDGELRTTPKGYGIKAFDLGSHGAAVPVEIKNPESLNLTAYAVRAPGHLFVTIINKEHGTSARAANVTVTANDISAAAQTISLIAPNGEVSTKTGITLGGGSISSSAPWNGSWTLLTSERPGQFKIKVEPASAIVLNIEIQKL